MKRTLPTLSGLLLTVLLCGLTMAHTTWAQSPHDLYQQALRLESSQGDLEGAIALYRRVAQASTSDRDLGARALYRMGQAYENLGRNEAAAAYRQIVRDYADQAETVAMARRRLTELDREAVRPVVDVPLLAAELVGLHTVEASMSRDGRYFVNTNWETRRLGYQEIGSPEVTYFTPDQGDLSRYQSAPITGRFSPNNRYIAYATDDTTAQYLKVFDRKDGSTRTIRTGTSNLPDMTWYFEVYDWTSDGTAILVILQEMSPRTANRGFDYNTSIALVDAVSGEIRASHRTDRGLDFGYRACLMNDRYALIQEESEAGGDIARLDLVTGSEDLFLADGSAKTLVGCSNARQAIVMRSVFNGLPQTYMQGVSDGMPAGNPVLIPEVAAKDIIIGLTDSGDLFYIAQADVALSADLYQWNPQTGSLARRLESLPVPTVQSTVDVNGIPGTRISSRPMWTSDGARLSYATDAGRLIRERDGNIHYPNSNGSRSFLWSADGTAFLHWTVNGTMRVDAETGEMSSAVPDDALIWSYRPDSISACLRQAMTHSIPEASQPYLACWEDRVSDDWVAGRAVYPYGITEAEFTVGHVVVPTSHGRRFRLTVVDGRTGAARIIYDDVCKEWVHSESQEDRDAGSMPQGVLPWCLIDVLPDDEGVLLVRYSGDVLRIPLDGSPPEPWLESLTTFRRVISLSINPAIDEILVVTSPRTEETGTATPRKISGLWRRLGVRD